VPFLDNGILSQFEGYERLEELDWKSLQEKHGDIQRLDRILEAEDDSPDRYKASKQADVLMLFFLFSSEELADLFQRMGYEWDPGSIPDCVDYYIKRTSHGSTLSRVVHAWVLSRSDRAGSWGLFSEALKSDISDIQGGTTSEGIHLGAMAGTVDLIQRCYAGIVTRDDVLWLNPRLPRELRHLRLHLRYRGDWFCLDVSQEELCVSLDEGAAGERTVGYQGMIHTVEPGEYEVFALDSGGSGNQSPGHK
jgi:alpha,alpha-trehalase